MNVGSKVIVKDNLIEEVKYGGIMFHHQMSKFRGKEVTIGNIPYKNNPSVVNVKEDTECYLWSREMFQ